MSDTTTDTFRMLMETTFDVAPPTPDLPQVAVRRSFPRPMLSLAGGFVAVLILVGAAVALMPVGDDSSSGVPSAAVTWQQSPVSDGYVVVAFAANDLYEPRAEIVDALNSRPEVVAILVVNKDEALVEARRIFADDSSLLRVLDENPGLLPASVRVLVESEQDAQRVSEYADMLPGVFGVESYYSYAGDIGTLPRTLTDYDPAPLGVVVTTIPEAVGVWSDRQLSDAGSVWVNQLGLNEAEVGVWSDRLDEICAPAVDITGLAGEYVAEDAQDSIRSDGTLPTSDEVVQTLEIIRLQACE